MSKIIKLTTEQYNYCVNNLSSKKSVIDEALHYPEFLDNVKFNIETMVCKCVSDMVSIHKEKLTTDLAIRSNLYFNAINVDITLIYNDDITDKKKYGGFSNSNETLTNDNKLDIAYLTFVFPVSENNEYDTAKISYVVSHEVGHLYDDWNELIRGGEGLFVNKNNRANTEFLQKYNASDNKLMRNIAWLCYMSLYTEKNAFAQQLMQELKGMKCNHTNVHEKFKETVSYKNLKETETDFFDSLKETDDLDLYDINSYIMQGHLDVSVPKLNVAQFDAKKYRAMLAKWGERTLHSISRRYFGVVQLYCDRLTESYFTKNCILIR